MEINKRTEERSERTRCRFPRCTGEALYNNKPCAIRSSIEIISSEEKNSRSNSLIVACKKNFVLLFELAGLPRYRSGSSSFHQQQQQLFRFIHPFSVFVSPPDRGKASYLINEIFAR